MASNLAVVYTNRIRKPAQSGLAYTTVGFRMLQRLVQSELAYPTSSLFSSSLSSRRCICLFHIVVSEYMPKTTYFSSRRCIGLFHIVKSEYMPKITYFSSCRCMSLFHRASPEYMSKFISFFAGSWIWDPGPSSKITKFHLKSF